MVCQASLYPLSVARIQRLFQAGKRSNKEVQRGIISQGENSLKQIYVSRLNQTTYKDWIENYWQAECALCKSDDLRAMVWSQSHKKRNPVITDGVSENWQRHTLPPCRAVPSAQSGLTSLFEMGRGDPRCYSHQKLLIR